MNLRKLFFGFLLLMSNIGLAQQSMQFTVAYNSALNRYEVFCLPDFTSNNFTWGPSQLTVVLPASMPNTPLPNLTSYAAGTWGDNSIIYDQFGSDFHGVESSGQLTNLVAGTQSLIFSFTLPAGCVSGVRLFNNGVDPDSGQPGMGGGDFGNTIDNGNITDVYAGNFNNAGSRCINAIDDNFAGTFAGGTVGNVLVNDFLDPLTGPNVQANLTNVTISGVPIVNPPLTINPDGSVVVAPNTPAGTYTINYSICEIGVPVNCDAAVVTVTVGTSPIIANYDFYYAPNGTTGSPNLGNAYLENDSLYGAPVIVANITGTVLDFANPVFLGASVPVLNTTTGVVSVPANTPAGTYYIEYRICETLNSLNCDTDTIEIKVDPPAIIATNDLGGPVIGTSGQLNVLNVLPNDSLNGLPVVPVQVTVTTLLGSSPQLFLNPNGSVNVLPGTLPGTYILNYSLCEVLNQFGVQNCDDATVTITVQSSPIIANVDTYGPIDGTAGNAGFGNIFGNDVLNGSPVIPANVTLNPAWQSSSLPVNVFINPNGTITVTPGTPAGTYTIIYEICETAAIPANSNCDTALVTIVVQPSPEIINITTPEDVPFTVCTDTLTNLLDPIVSVTPCGFGGPTNGTFVPNPSEGPTCFTYTPNWNFNGNDQACLVTCTASGVCDTTFFNITVTPVNDAPTTNDVNVVTSVNTPVGVNVGAGTSDPENNPLTYEYQDPTTVLNGTYTIDGNGTITVTPDDGFEGDITITFTVCDESIYPITVLCDQGIITVTVIDTTGGVNNPPVANTDQATTPQDVTVTVSAIANDFDVDGDDLTLDLVTTTSPNGTITNNGDGTLTFNPNPTFTGIDTILYEICDNGSPVLCDIDTIFIYVVPVVDEPNVAPIATDDYVSTPEDVNVIIAVLNNDSDPNGNDLSNPTIVSQPTNGTVDVLPDGTIEYDPNLNFYGTDTFTYYICDTGSPVLCDTATVVITITPANDAPTTTNVDVVTSINTPVGVNVGAGTSDPENNPLTYTYGPASNGTFTIDGTGTITVTPPTGFTGIITIPFEVCDLSQFQVTSLCDQGLITVTVIDPSNGNNNPPIANNDFATVPVNTPQVIVNPLANDFDVDGDNLTVFPGLPTSGGVITGNVILNPGGTVTYSPPPGFTGTVTIPYTICDDGTPILCDNAVITIVISPVVDEPNVAPIATDDYATTPEDTDVMISVMQNDSDPNGNGISFSGIITPPANGIATPIVGGAPGLVNYNPNPGFVGLDSFEYVICDNGNPSLCDTAWVYINIIPVNENPVAVDDNYVTNEDTDLVLIPAPAGNDTDPDAGDVLSVTIMNGVPVTPGTPLVTPVSVPNGDVFYDGINFTFVPDPEFVGVVSFPYTVCDNAVVPECDDAIITITVLPVTDTTSVTVPEGGVITLCTGPLTNFGSSPDVSISICEQPSNGVLGAAAGTTCFTYTPNGDDNDTICVITCAANGFCDTTIFVITVTPVNDTPVAVDDNYVTNEDTPLTLNPNPTNPVSNDTDPEGDALTITNINGTTISAGIPSNIPVTNGNINVAADGTITFTPELNFVGVTSFPYTVCDNGPLCDNAIITITVLPITDTTSVTVPEGGVITLCTGPLTNFGSSPDVSISICEQPSNGVLGAAVGTTCFTYTPNGDDNDTICVITCAANGFCDTTIFVITVTPNPDVIVAVDDNETTDSDTPVDIDVLDNDTTPNPLTCFNIVTQPTAGDVTINADSTITYTPDGTGCGTDSFTYVICDAFTSDTATVTINLNDVTPPVFTNCPSDTIFATAMINTCWSQVYWPTPIVTDNCGSSTVFVTSNFPNGYVFPVGDHTVIVIATDAEGNSDSCEFVVSVIDSQAPIFNLCPTDLFLDNDPGVCGAVATWIEPTVFDNCGGFTVTSTSSSTQPLANGDEFPVGTTTMTYIVVDASGLSDTCTFNVTVTDTEAPVLTNAPSDITVYATATNCDIQVTWTEPTVADNCGIDTVIVSHANGSVFSVDTDVTYTVTDVNGNVTTHTFTVFVEDTIAPIVTNCPTDLVVDNDPGVCGAVVTWNAPVATDNCSDDLTVEVISSYASGDVFPVGDHEVIYIFTDAEGNADTCQFTVTVEDNEGPSISGLPVGTLAACANSPITWDEPVVTDNCGDAGYTLTSNPLGYQSGDVFPIGTTTMTYNLLDDSGNSSTYSFDVVVSPAPTVEIDADDEIELCLGENFEFAVANPSSSLTYTWSLFSSVLGTGSTYTIESVTEDDEGDYIVSATDASGCSATDIVEVNVDNCGIRIPEAFTPNGNGTNEVFFIENLESYPNTEIIIFNRWGSEVYESDDYKNDWAGVSQNKLNFAGDQLPEGTYFYVIKLGGKETDATFGKIYKGYVYIKR